MMEFLYQDTCLVPEKDVEQTGKLLAEYLAFLRSVLDAGAYEVPESSINLPSDEKLFAEIERLSAEKAGKELKYIIVIGIGGSNLGTKAVYDALYGYTDILEPRRRPKMFFADTNDPEFLMMLRAFLDAETKRPEEVLVNIVSKSGGTMETIANAEFILHALRERLSGMESRTVVATDVNSKLWKAAEKRGIARLAIPAPVGGRYSLLSAVGLFPLSAAGINIRTLAAGAIGMRDRCLAENAAENPALAGAALHYLHLKQGRTISDNFYFHPELESLGKWHRQLMAESIGKERDADGKTVNAGITPTVSIGSTDLHSMGQLYLGGPKDKFTTFVWSKRSNADTRVPSDQMFPELSESVTEWKTAEIMRAVLEGVKIAYAKKELPFAEALLPDLSEASLGEFAQWKMIETMLLAKLLNVNAFDQPNVEMYKIATKKILS